MTGCAGGRETVQGTREAPHLVGREEEADTRPTGDEREGRSTCSRCRSL